jgi:hypothetical protein
LLLGSALVVALGLAACGADGGNHSRTGSPDGPSTSTPPPTDADDTSTSTTPPGTEAEPPLRRPKPNVRLSVTPPPVKPPSGPADRLEPVTETDTQSQPAP